jgi:type I restriction enzyme M protein
MPATVVVLRSTKAPERKGRVLFINAVKEFAREQAQSFLREPHQTKILNAYRDFTDVGQFAAVATLDQIADKNFSLAIPLYVADAKAADVGEHLSVIDALADWRSTSEASDAAIADVLSLLRTSVSA